MAALGWCNWHKHLPHHSSTPTSTMPPSADNDSPDLEIVGLYACSNGRSCSRHETCGQHVKVGNVLRLVKCVVTIKGRAEEAVKLVKIQDGCDSCTVAFVPHVFTTLPKVTRNINKFVQVIKIYKDSENTHKHHLSNQNHGMASVIFLDAIPVDEW